MIDYYAAAKEYHATINPEYLCNVGELARFAKWLVEVYMKEARDGR
jgi:hypothetical protein